MSFTGVMERDSMCLFFSFFFVYIFGNFTYRYMVFQLHVHIYRGHREGEHVSFTGVIARKMAMCQLSGHCSGDSIVSCTGAMTKQMAMSVVYRSHGWGDGCLL